MTLKQKTRLSLYFLLFGSLSLGYAERVSLDGTWEFQIDPYQVGEEEGWEHGMSFHDTLEVPGNWDLLNEYSEYAGKAWYRKTIDVPADWEGKRIQLHFDAVYNDSKIWVNSEKVGENDLGFYAFHFEVADKLRYGAQNSIVVMADSTFKRGAIWNWGGIRRSVWLDVGDPIRIDRQWITADPDLDTGTATVRVDLDLSSHSPSEESVDVYVDLSGQGVSKKQVQTIPLEGEGDLKTSFVFALSSDEVKLWHFNSPSLYRSTVELVRGNRVVQELSDRFGIRKIEVDGVELKLNGESLRLMGANVVPEDRTTGSTLPTWRIQEDVDLLKSLGANMMRVSHLPLPKAYLDYLDEKGILTFEEVPLWGRDIMVDPEHPKPKQWLTDLIKQRYNHPSVIGWSVGNEIGRVSDNPKVFEYIEGAIAQTKAEDPTRLAVYVSHSAQYSEVDAVKYSDMILINSYSNLSLAGDNSHKWHGPKPVFLLEFGKHLNHEDPNLGIMDAEKMVGSLRERKYLMGGSLWTYNDYRSFWQSADPTWSTPPSQNRAWGLVNVFRQPKRAWYDFKKEYAPLSGLKVELSAGNTVRASMTARDPLDLPAFPLNGYRLVTEVVGADGSVLEGSVGLVPTIEPNSETHHIETGTLSALERAVRIDVSLLDPQGYVAMHEVVYLKAPKPPIALATHPSKTEVRLVFEKQHNAQEHWVEYEQDGQAVSTEPTINSFITVPGLKQGEEYAFRLVASNEKGSTEATDQVRVTTDFNELPPVIWATEGGDGCGFVGFTVGQTDYLYEVRYGKTSGNYDRTISFKTRGVARIPNLENGQTYYMQLRRRMQWGFASDWSHELTVTPMGPGRSSESVDVRSTHETDNSVLVGMQPLKHAISYTASWENQRGESVSQTITGSKLDFLILENTGWVKNLSVKANF